MTFLHVSGSLDQRERPAASHRYYSNEDSPKNKFMIAEIFSPRGRACASLAF